MHFNCTLTCFCRVHKVWMWYIVLCCNHCLLFMVDNSIKWNRYSARKGGGDALVSTYVWMDKCELECTYHFIPSRFYVVKTKMMRTRIQIHHRYFASGLHFIFSPFIAPFVAVYGPVVRIYNRKCSTSSEIFGHHKDDVVTDNKIA